MTVFALEPPDPKVLWVVSWGFDVPGLIQRLKGRRVRTTPTAAPTASTCRLVFRSWPSAATPGLLGQQSSPQPLVLVPNALDQTWLDRGDRAVSQRRPIDVLVQARKSSPYVLRYLVPALRQAGLEVEVQTGWVDDLVELFNRSTVYLYDSAEYWRTRRDRGFRFAAAGGIGLRMRCVQQPQSRPGGLWRSSHTVHQVGCGRLSFDLERIHGAVASPQSWRPSSDRLEDFAAGVFRS